MVAERYRDRSVWCYILDDNVMKEAKEYCKEIYVSLSKLLFFALKEKLERDRKIKERILLASAPTTTTITTGSQ